MIRLAHLFPSLLLLAQLLVTGTDAFLVRQCARPLRHRRHASSSSSASSTQLGTTKKTLGLLTFDLDDSLYPIAPVLDEANAAFKRAMARFGYDDGNIQPQDIVDTARQIRDEFPPEEAAVLTHTEIRTLAIRRKMEEFILKKKLQETADSWATQQEDLSPIVVNFAKKWAKEAVSPNVVQAVLNAWEMERHHAAERHLYPEVISALQEIKRNHPDVIIGAVTDGRANPLFMTFTLAPYFDFCLSWEDDQASRRKFFQDLGRTEGKEDLKWIYDAALEKYQELSAAKMGLSNKAEPSPHKLWIHVGDDLAYDVGGSAQSGAKTIYLELADKYEQTARQRVDQPNVQPSWSTTPKEELEKRRSMNEIARNQVDATVHYLSRLPEAIQDIIDKENEKISSGKKENKEGASVK